MLNRFDSRFDSILTPPEHPLFTGYSFSSIYSIYFAGVYPLIEIFSHSITTLEQYYQIPY